EFGDGALLRSRPQPGLPARAMLKNSQPIRQTLATAQTLGPDFTLMLLALTTSSLGCSHRLRKIRSSVAPPKHHPSIFVTSRHSASTAGKSPEILTHPFGSVTRIHMAMTQRNVDQALALAKERYAALGVNVEQALRTLATIPISLHCWQGDDVGGFERANAE